MNFRPFSSYDLDLHQMTFIYEIDPYSLEIYGCEKYKFTTLKLDKVIV